MDSIVVIAAHPILAESCAAVPGAATGRSADYWLLTIDLVLFGLASVGVLGAAVWWILHSGRDPLRDCPPRPNRLREDALAAAMLVYLVAALAFGGLARTLSGEDGTGLESVLAGTGAQIAGAVICLAVAAQRFDGGVGRFVAGSGRVRGGMPLRQVVAVTVVALAMCPVVLAGTVKLVRFFAPAHEFPLHPTIDVLSEGDTSAAGVLALWFGAVVVAPIAEEAFFRGLLQTWLVNTLQNRWVAVIAAALVFAAMHASQPQAIPALVLLAVIMGYAYERSGALLPAILIHAVFNLKTLVWHTLGAFPPGGAS